MKVIKGNIWDYWKNGYTVIIPTNGFIKKDGSLVMGKGLAYQCKNRFKNIEYQWGHYITINNINLNNRKVFYDAQRLIYFPVKNNWWEKADLNLIKDSCQELRDVVDKLILKKIVIPKVGCGNGQLNWKEVKSILDLYLDNRFIVVDLE